MVKIWSELPASRLKEQAADIATIAWVVSWGSLILRLFQYLAGFTDAGRSVHDGGQTMVEGGRELGDSLAGLPLIGSQVRDIVRSAFGDAGRPLAEFGTQLEQFIFVVAVVLTLMLAFITLGPWLARYVPWRYRRLRNVRAGQRAVRTAPHLDDATMERTLAMRAVSRLDYATLLEYTSDPLGDWAGGRYEQLARAELASVGLRP